MNIVVDTNVMTESITERSQYHKIYKSISQEKHYLTISNEIVCEYFEIFEIIYPIEILDQINIFFSRALNIILTNPHYRFNLIQTDPDDNKFVDAAICGNADFIITSDKHFNVLKTVDFPKVEVISPQDFIDGYC